MLEHGGQLRAAARLYRIDLPDWIDLSTGVNPNGWPVPPVPAECWQRLPETDDELLPAAQTYYRATSILPVAGTQAAIQMLPRLRARSRVGVLRPAYAEHAANWKKAGHQVVELSPDEIDGAAPELDVLVIVNPNNPTGLENDREQLLNWHHTLRRRRGWLLVDEAFIDCQPDNSLADHPAQEGLIVLRSLGKFFGLAGLRSGFVIGEPVLLRRLQQSLGPWTVSHPARYVAARALLDVKWQQRTRTELPLQATRLRQLLSNCGLSPHGGCSLFQWARTPRAADIHHLLAKQGILTRMFSSPVSLRFGLPGNERQWNALERALSALGRCE